jgi:geranylgeranylglycerol-phosphate geranylgeranyltransferase
MNNQVGSPGRHRQVVEVATGSVWPTLVGIGRLMRLSNSLPAAALVLIGGKLVAGWPLAGRVWLAAAAMWAISAFGYVSNDLTDLAEDRINKPDRPLVSGLVSLSTGNVVAAILAIGGTSLAASLGCRELLVALVVVGLLCLYNLRLKASAGGGNLLVALLAGCTLITGGVAERGYDWRAMMLLSPPALLLTTFVAARELVKTLEDVAGDRAIGKRTMALAYGERAVVQIVGGLAGAGALLSLFAVAFGGYSLWFLLFGLAGVQTPLLLTVVSLWAQPTSQRATRSLRWLKASYFLGLVALLLA